MSLRRSMKDSRVGFDRDSRTKVKMLLKWSPLSKERNESEEGWWWDGTLPVSPCLSLSGLSQLSHKSCKMYQKIKIGSPPPPARSDPTIPLNLLCRYLTTWAKICYWEFQSVCICRRRVFISFLLFSGHNFPSLNPSISDKENIQTLAKDSGWEKNSGPSNTK